MKLEQEVNKYNISELEKIINIKDIRNISENEEFDYLRIISMKHKGIEDKSKNILFFPITLDQKLIDDGWIDITTDLKTPINEIISKFPEYTFVVEEDMIIEDQKAKLVIVDDIMKSIDILYDHVLNNHKYEVVAVTGSAGKTTSIGVIEEVLKSKYNVLRIYSDRITPIVLKANIINFLNQKIDVVTLEMGIFFKDHVKALSDLIKPTISAMLNIGSAHLGEPGLNKIDDICINKAMIFRNPRIGFINKDNSYLKDLKLKENKLYYKENLLFETNLKELKEIYPSRANVINNCLYINNNQIKVPILTELTALQYQLAYDIGIYLNIEKTDIIKSLNEFEVVENRLQRINIFGKEVIFDGDSSFKERIHQLSNHLYDKAYFVIRKYGADYYIDDFKGITEYFDKFEKVYLFDDINYLEDLKNHPKVEIVNNHDFMKNLDGEIFYHYCDYFYKYADFDLENLK